MTYKEKLEATKVDYPFDHWRELFYPEDEDDEDDEGMEQYTPENCDKAQAVLDNLINQLVLLGENAEEKDKVKLFENAILQLNDLNNLIRGLIETGEREDLCELFDKITVACGLNPEDYGGGEGIADDYREW
jgi:hypothetical protein